MKNQTKLLVILVAVLGAVCILVGVIGLLPANQNQSVYSNEVAEGDIFDVVVPWEEEGAKQPEDYTKDEYEALSFAQKVIFVESFDNDAELKKWQDKHNVKIEKYPWELGGKTPDQYSLQEYLSLSEQWKVAFIRFFESQQKFEEWLHFAEKEAEPLPWENGEKLPNEYTFAEYMALTEKHQIIFQEWFKNPEDFEIWVTKAQNDGSLLEKNPWEIDGRRPSDYTLIEYESLTNAQKVAFKNAFDSENDFDVWLDKVSKTEETMPWETGGKKPSEYTFEEFNSLTKSQQIAFQKWFGSEAEFDAWLSKVSGSASSSTVYPWENGGKQPSEYTLAEFNALTGAQQIAFQNSFGSTEAFDAWLNKVQGNPSAEALPWENGGKQPSEYTLAEFNALTGAQQIAFQKWFASESEFNVWLTNAQGETNTEIYLPWLDGGKLPPEYTWEEFEALEGPQQIAFQNYFENFEDFEAWMNAVTGNE